MQDGKPSPLHAILRARFPMMWNAFVLEWTPEQGEDIFVVLIDDESVATVEILREGQVSAFEVESLDEYRSKLRSKKSRIQLIVALDLLTTKPLLHLRV